MHFGNPVTASSDKGKRKEEAVKALIALTGCNGPDKPSPGPPSPMPPDPGAPLKLSPGP